jgi:predicted enzyme related to lactoylglutathione lyase
MPDPAIPSIGAVALDCPDPVALASFYARLLDWPVPAAGDDDEWVTLPSPTGGPALAFQRATDHVAPTWPRPDVPQQLHIDFEVADLEAAHARAVELGARLLDTQETFRVYADPVGHPFCLCAC